MNLPLPQDTRQSFVQINQQCSNLSLLLDRYIPYRDNWKFDGKDKNEIFTNIANSFGFSSDLLHANYQRWQKRVKSFPYYQYFNSSPEWRMIIGLGQTTTLETNITLDRITGLPIIPGSALKGLAASYALLCVLEKTNRISEVEEEYHKFLKQKNYQLSENYLEFIKIFGYEGEIGQVIFLDAVPTKVPKLEPDIMNNHYPDYYNDTTGRTAPTPYQNPNPVYFLTLGKESQFAFAVVSRTLNEDSSNLVNIACEWLKKGLSELGIGSKTAAGYGYFHI